MIGVIILIMVFWGIMVDVVVIWSIICIMGILNLFWIWIGLMIGRLVVDLEV